MIDTNVPVSGILGVSYGTQTAPAALIRRWAAGDFELAISDHILDEVRRTLSKPWFSSRISQSEIDAILTPLERTSVYASVSNSGPLSPIASHPEDDLVLAAVVATNADLLVTGDVMLLKLMKHRRAMIISARQFLEILAGA